MSIINNPLLLGAPSGGGGGGTGGGGINGYQISRSLRFNSADSAYLSRTPASAGNRKTWTWAGWVKLTGSNGYIFSGGNIFYLYVFSDGVIRVSTAAAGVNSTRNLRDPAAWYHVVLSVDSTQTTEANRVRIYINGELDGTNFGSILSQNADTTVNGTSVHTIGKSSTVAEYFSGYLADIHFIDGQALDPTSFGEFDDNGIWQPKAYSGGSYGTNGFKLDFADNSSATALGYDAAGSNDWTPNNLSVAAGSGNDSLVDSPTSYGTDTGAGGEVRGNYCTWNPLKRFENAFSFANGNLDVSAPNDSLLYTTIGTVAVPASGKYYWEITPTTLPSVNDIWISLVTEANAALNEIATVITRGVYRGTGEIYNLAGATATSGASYAANDAIGVAVDADNGTVNFYKNGVRQGANPSFSFTAGTILFPRISTDNNAGAVAATANFGQRPFAYTAPSGFKALNTANLPAPVVTKPSDLMDVLLWSGTGGNRSLTGLGMSPDFVWIKQRNQAFSVGHQLYDIVRGAGSLKQLDSSNTTAEGGGNTNQYGYLSSFDSAGFSVTAGSVDSDYVNKSGVTYVAWCWDAGSSTVTNTAGTISSQVRANPSAGFSVVTYTGTGAAGSVGHGLGVTPGMIIVKARSNTTNNDWMVYHSRLDNPPQDALRLNSIGTAWTNNTYPWNSSVTSTVFGVSPNGSFGISSSGVGYVAYCFAPVAGYSAFGSYTGNGSSADGPFVFCNFRPRWVLFKNNSAATGWQIYDSARNTYNLTDNELCPSDALDENANGVSNGIDFLSNGFKLRSADSWLNSVSAHTYVYAAFAEHPFALARAR